MKLGIYFDELLPIHGHSSVKWGARMANQLPRAEAALLVNLRRDFSLPTTAATGRTVLQGMVGLIDGHVIPVLEGGQAMAARWAADQMVKRPPGNKLHRHGEQQGESHGRGKRDELQPGQPAGKQQTPDQYHRAEFG